MRSFAELLTEYMARTGISDSELARTLGVRRQTIFRWKEGLTEKPRYREDILRVADRLRLSSEERDGLLLSAGFPPETPAAIVPAAPAEILTPIPRRTDKNLRLLAVLLAGLAVMSIIVVFRFWSPTLYPVAAQGETLVLIAPLSSSAAPTLVPSRQVPAESETPAPSDVSERLRAALERELQAARLEPVRVVIGPEKVTDVTMAERARLRSKARLVIYGRYENGALYAMIDPAPASFRADDLPLDALVAAPTDLPLKIDLTAQEQVQALALYTLAQIYTDQGDLEKARAALARLPSTQPAWLAESGYLYQLGEPPDWDQAIDFYTQAISIESNAKTALLNRGVAAIRQNKPAQWSADLTRVLALEPNHQAAHQALCWGYALDNQPEAALPHCEAAVRLDPTLRSRDVRGIVYAEAGRLKDAANDWQVFVNWLAQQPEALRVRYGSTRSEWLQAAQAGRNPIDNAALERLRQQ